MIDAFSVMMCEVDSQSDSRTPKSHFRRVAFLSAA